MNRSIQFKTMLTTSLTTLAIAGATFAQEHGAAEHGGGHNEASVLPTPLQGLVPLITALIVFLIVLGVLSTLAWPKILKGLKDRENKIRDEIQSAEMARKQAKDALEQYEKSLADARAEAQKMLEKARTQQQALADELRAKADAEMSAMKDKARREIEAAKREALADLYQTASELATGAASKILRREVNASDSRRMIEETMANLPA
jgi:F-type H+-transporting ATPase subunit b